MSAGEVIGIIIILIFIAGYAYFFCYGPAKNKKGAIGSILVLVFAPASLLLAYLYNYITGERVGWKFVIVLLIAVFVVILISPSPKDPLDPHQ
jgi:drug/metabolite transporter (DMT)-like permease